MLDRNNALELILKGCNDTFAAQGFKVNMPENSGKDASPVFEDGETAYIEIEKNNLKLRFISAGDLLEVAEGDEDGEFKKIETNLFDLEAFDERDIKSLVNEINDTVVSSYGKKSAKAASKKAPVPVSKKAAKNGDSAYDAYTLANRLLALYPQLKEAYQENYQRYGEFLGEDFFVNHANEYILGTIKSYDKMSQKKLFKILTDIYQNGSSDTQDLVAVTILGEMNNDKELLEKLREFTDDDDFYDTVAAVNAYLATASGKKARKQMENPPKYKPKKEKKGMMSQLMGGMQMPQQ